MEDLPKLCKNDEIFLSIPAISVLYERLLLFLFCRQLVENLENKTSVCIH